MKSYKLRMPIGELFEFLNIDNDLYGSVQIVDRNVSIKNPKGEFVNINAFVKKQGYVREYTCENDVKIKCDERHLVKQKNGEYKFINTCDHIIVNENVVKILKCGERKFKDVYDVSLDFPHEYVTSNGIVCHNTTIAKILANAIDADVMYVNASDNNGIDFIRDKIRPFAASNGFTDFKIIILDECLGEDTCVWVLRNGTEQSIKIKDVDDKQDLVKSFNIKTSNIEWRPFILWDKGEQECVKMELDNGEVVVCTYDHKWYVYDDNMEIIKMKMSDIIKNNIDYILSPV